MNSVEPSESEVEACCRSVTELLSTRSVNVEQIVDAPPHQLRLKLTQQEVEWIIDVDCSWPQYTALPSIRLIAPLTLLAHVSYGGAICINDSQGLSIDIDRQPDVVAYAVWLAIDLLEKSLEDARLDRAEFFNELAGYWSSLPNTVITRAAFDVDAKDRLLSGRIKTRGNYNYWFLTEKDVPPPTEFRIDKSQKFSALYVDLSEPILPPLPGELLDSHYIDRIVDLFSDAQRQLWHALLGPSMNGSKQLALFVSTPRRDGGKSVIGMSFTALKRVLDSKAMVRPLTVRRHTANHMRNRGGASNALASKHIVVIGCGSVGSEVADALATSGVNCLTLVDPEFLTEDNIFRHVLEPSWIDLAKVLGLQFVLESHYPGLKVIPVCGHGEDWVTTANISSVDGIVLALGAPTLERAMLRQLRLSDQNIPVITTWLEPLDLGGHAVGVNLKGPGCLDCLYRDDEGAPSLSSRTSFLEAGQQVSRNLTGCGGAFVPYGALQSRRTALMATELMLAAVAGDKLPKYRFWSGSGQAAIAENLRVTQWWHLSKKTSEDEATKMIFVQPCLQCRESQCG